MKISTVVIDYMMVLFSNKISTSIEQTAFSNTREIFNIADNQVWAVCAQTWNELASEHLKG